MNWCHGNLLASVPSEQSRKQKGVCNRTHAMRAPRRVLTEETVSCSHLAQCLNHSGCNQRVPARSIHTFPWKILQSQPSSRTYSINRCGPVHTLVGHHNHLLIPGERPSHQGSASLSGPSPLLECHIPETGNHGTFLQYTNSTFPYCGPRDTFDFLPSTHCMGILSPRKLPQA